METQETTSKNDNAIARCALPAGVPSLYALIDDHRARASLAAAYSSPRCPACGLPVRNDRMQSWLAWGRQTCPACGRWYTATTGTMLQGAKMSPGQLAIILVLLVIGLPLATVADQAGVSYETARAWRARLGGASA